MYQQDGPDPQSNCATFAVEKLMQILQKIVSQMHRKVKRNAMRCSLHPGYARLIRKFFGLLNQNADDDDDDVPGASLVATNRCSLAVRTDSSQLLYIFFFFFSFL